MNKNLLLDPFYYHNNSSKQVNLAKKFLKTLTFRGDETTLDIGCGSGELTAFLATLLPKGTITGIDPSNEMIEYAKHHFSHSAFFKKQSAEELSDINQFDIVFSFSSFHWISEPKIAVENIKLSLKSNGRACILCFSCDSDFFSAVLETLNKAKWEKYKKFLVQNSFYSSEDYKNLFHSSGLQIQDFLAKEEEIIFSSKEEFKSHLRGWFNSLITLEKPLQEEFFVDLLEKLREKNDCEKNGSIKVLYKKITAILKKERM